MLGKKLMSCRHENFVATAISSCPPSNWRPAISSAHKLIYGLLSYDGYDDYLPPRLVCAVHFVTAYATAIKVLFFEMPQR